MPEASSSVDTLLRITAADGRLLQAPFRAGIQLLNHQLTPLVKALALPRCNLFIADDVGLGKTIEAGLVLQELQLRQRVDFDRTLQPSHDVWCHYFVYPDRAEDAVLDRLVEKIDRIQRELGTLGEVVVQRVERALSQGIRSSTGVEIDAAEQFTERERTAKEELESQRRTTERLRGASRRQR